MVKSGELYFRIWLSEVGFGSMKIQFIPLWKWLLTTIHN